MLDLGTLSGRVELDTAAFDRGRQNVERAIQALSRMKSPDVEVQADVQDALTALAKVDAGLREVSGVTAEAEARVDGSAAEAALRQVDGLLSDLDSETATAKVDADTSPAEDAISDGIGGAAKKAGDEAGEDVAGGIISSLKTIPIAGAIIGVGVAIAGGLLAGIKKGMAVEARNDLFSAQTGLDEATSAKFGRAAGEAYANAWGGSVQENLDAARTAVQQGLLDPAATQRDVQQVIEGLQAVGTVLEEDVGRAAVAAGNMVKTGMADSAEAAFDVLIRGQQAGVNGAEDLIDTFTEYPSVLAKLGLSAEDSLGLMSQALEAGARNSDVAADALKEFQIRATDGSKLSAEGFALLGMSAEEMTAKIAAGGEGAREGLQEVLDGLRAIEDPVARNAAGVALFGTKYEDMGDTLLAMDLSGAVTQLEGVEGAAARAMETIGGNAATELESAKRNIQLAADGVAAALASAFSDEISGAAQWVQRNRGPMLETLVDIMNGAFDAGKGFLALAAGATEGLAGIIDAAAGVLYAIDRITPGDQGAQAFQQWADEVGGSMRGAADQMRGEWTDNLSAMQDKANDWAAPAILAAHISDAVQEAEDRLPQLSAAIDATGGEIKINGEAVGAEDALAYMLSQVNEADGTVEINGETVAAEDALDVLLGLVNSGQGDVQIAATKVKAEEALSSLLGAVASSEDSITIAGDDMPARDALDAILAAVAAGEEDVTIGGNTYPAEMATGALLSWAGGRWTDVNVDADTGPATATAGRWQPGSKWISANADLTAAKQTVANWRPYVNLTMLGQIAVARGGPIMGFDTGGRVSGPGTGTSDSIVADGPLGPSRYRLSDGEHIWTADDVQDVGGHGNVYRLRRMAQDGRLRELLADGGEVDGLVAGWTASSSSGGRLDVASLREAFDGATLEITGMGTAADAVAAVLHTARRRA